MAVMNIVTLVTFVYVIASFVFALTFADPTVGGDFPRTLVFWPLLFIKWVLKQLFDILLKDWRD